MSASLVPGGGYPGLYSSEPPIPEIHGIATVDVGMMLAYGVGAVQDVVIEIDVPDAPGGGVGDRPSFTRGRHVSVEDLVLTARSRLRSRISVRSRVLTAAGVVAASSALHSRLRVDARVHRGAIEGLLTGRLSTQGGTVRRRVAFRRRRVAGVVQASTSVALLTTVQPTEAQRRRLIRRTSAATLRLESRVRLGRAPGPSDRIRAEERLVLVDELV